METAIPISSIPLLASHPLVIAYGINTLKGDQKILYIAWKSEDQEELSSIDYYDELRESIQAWLFEFHPGHILNDTGDADIEPTQTMTTLYNGDVVLIASLQILHTIRTWDIIQ